MDTLVHVLTIVGSAVGVTWVIRSKLSDIETAMTSLASRVAASENKILKLEDARAARKRR